MKLFTIVVKTEAPVQDLQVQEGLLSYVSFKSKSTQPSYFLHRPKTALNSI